MMGVLIISADRSSYSDGGLLYIIVDQQAATNLIQQLFEISRISSLKKTQNVNFEWFLGPNSPFCLFSHYLLCPTGPVEE